MLSIFHEVSQACSKVTTERYSTSFSSAIRLLNTSIQTPIYNIYGFVRFADEIVDTFHDHDKDHLLAQFKKETYDAIERGISLNPIYIVSVTVNQFNIDHALIEAFFRSMEFDLIKSYDQTSYQEYTYGSAEVVGLMCICTAKAIWQNMKTETMPLPWCCLSESEFLRDVKPIFTPEPRLFFPCGLTTTAMKQQIEDDITDFQHAYEGIIKLPLKAFWRLPGL
jgi:phytoene/squalene synthetase